MKIVKFLLISFIAVSALALSGCFSVKYPVRSQYVLPVQLPHKAKHALTSAKLEINSVTVDPQFSGLSFVYRLSDINYTEDYYNIFLNSPGQQIQRSIADYLTAKNIFSYVTARPGIVYTDYILYADVKSLYADYQNSAYPKAVINIHFTLCQQNRRSTILLNKTYQAAVRLSRKNSASLVHAWGKGLTLILGHLTHDLQKRIKP